MSRVVALGLDSADARYVDELVAAGVMPHLARLRSRAARVPLVTDEPYRAEIPWTEFTTGRRAATLRYWGTTVFEPESYSTFMGGASPAEPFYALGPEVPVVALDVPKVVRPPAVEGIQVLGWGAHSPQHPLGSRPDGVLDDIRSRHGPHPAMAVEYAGTWNQPAWADGFGAAQAAGARRRADVLADLAERRPDWRLLTTLFGETHQSGHMLWHGSGDGLLARSSEAATAARAFRSIHRAIDDAIGAVVAWVPADATVVVFSVQGMTDGADDTAAALLAEVLSRAATGRARVPAGDLARWRAAGAPPVVPRPWEDTTTWLARRFDVSPAAARRRGTREWLRATARHRAPGILRARRRLLGLPPDPGPQPAAIPTDYPFRDESINGWHPAAWYADAWPGMPAFVVPGFSDAHVRINLAGRERDGVVDPADYARACDDVERLVADARSGRDGGPIVLDVVRMRADDPFDPDGPTADLVVRCRSADALEHPLVGVVGPVAVARTGSHTRHGFADVAGPGIAPGPRPTRAVVDLSASIVRRLGAHPRAPLDGTPFLDPAPAP